MVLVKLLRRYGLCNGGETCGVPDEVAPELFKRGIAAPIDGPPPPVEQVTQDVDEDIEVLGLTDREGKAAAAPMNRMLPMAPGMKGRRR